jgi:IS4 transposase
VHPQRLANPDARSFAVGDKRYRQLQRRAWDAGWWPVRTKKGVAWLAPDGVAQVVLHNTPSDRRAYDNVEARFRAAGLQTRGVDRR